MTFTLVPHIFRGSCINAAIATRIYMYKHSLAKPRLHTRREGLDNCLYAKALHEIVQPNQIADRGNVTYAHIPPPTLCQSAIYMYIVHVVHGTPGETGPLIMSLRVYQGCCYVSGYYYAKDRATRSHQTVRARQRCVCIVAYGIWKECLLFSPPVRVCCLRRVEKKSIVVVASPLVALMKDQVAQCSSCGLAAGFVSTDPNDHSMRL